MYTNDAKFEQHPSNVFGDTVPLKSKLPPSRETRVSSLETSVSSLETVQKTVSVLHKRKLSKD